MKKIISVIMICVLGLGILSSCGKDSAVQTNEPVDVLAKMQEANVTGTRVSKNAYFNCYYVEYKDGKQVSEIGYFANPNSYIMDFNREEVYIVTVDRAVKYNPNDRASGIVAVQDESIKFTTCMEKKIFEVTDTTVLEKSEAMEDGSLKVVISDSVKGESWFKINPDTYEIIEGQIEKFDENGNVVGKIDIYCENDGAYQIPEWVQELMNN
ncbi:MAG: hypothetical protein Q4B31_04490 [Clostridia bacterium]|nr:hypothetical protein [Clostridia bacterium]